MANAVFQATPRPSTYRQGVPADLEAVTMRWAYVRPGLSNGRTEGLNGKARTITRWTYGFRSAAELIALLMLCCSGMHLEPVFHYPGSTR
jgi:hypothetical protein